MGLVKDYGLDSFARKWLLVLLKLPDRKGQKATDILRINKMLKYFDYLLDQKNIDFSCYKLGAVSDEVHETVDEFEECDLITKDQRANYSLTKDGQLATKELGPLLDEKETKLLQHTKNLLNDMTDDELLFFMYMTFPVTTKNSTEFPRLFRKKGELVKSLYVKGKISAATGAKWLNVPETEFLEKYKIQLNE